MFFKVRKAGHRERPDSAEEIRAVLLQQVDQADSKQVFPERCRSLYPCVVQREKNDQPCTNEPVCF